MALDDIGRIVFASSRGTVREQLLNETEPTGAGSVSVLTSSATRPDLYIAQAGGTGWDSPTYRLSQIEVSAGQGSALSHLAAAGRRITIPFYRRSAPDLRAGLNQVITRRQGTIFFSRLDAGGNFTPAASRRLIQTDYIGERPISDRILGGYVMHNMFFYAPFPWAIGQGTRTPGGSATATTFNITLPAVSEGPMCWAILTAAAGASQQITFTVNNFTLVLTAGGTGGAQFLCPTPELGESSGAVSGFLPPYLMPGETYTFTSTLACAVSVFPSYLAV